jgi:hypothetical protein
MILLYTAVVLLLGAVTMIVKLRAKGLEHKFAGVAKTVDQLARQPESKPGNSNKLDLCQSAKRSYQLGQLVAVRDRVEVKHYAWQRWAERLVRWQKAVHDWRGVKLPYTLGALDVWLLLCLIDHCGAGEYLSTRIVVDSVLSWLSREK